MNWLARLFRHRRLEQQLDRELRFHFDSQVADKIEAGMSPGEARRTTRLEFGGMEQIKQQTRESRGTLWLTSILDDLRFGARLLLRSPGFSLTAIVVFALGIGVNTLAFSLYDLLTLKSLPVRDPETLVSIERRSPGNINPGVPWNSIVFYRDNAKTLSAVIASMDAGSMALDQDAQHIHPTFVTANYLAELGAQPAAGRLFDPSSEDSPAASPVAVLGYRFWQRRYHGSPDIVGRTIDLSGKPATVIGVLPASFASLGTASPDLWLPLSQHSYFVEGSKPLDDPEFGGLIIMSGRLAAGVTRAAAAEELLTLTNRLRPLYPKVIWDHEYIVVTPGAHFFTFGDGQGPPILPLVFSLVGLILAVACANLAGLLTARGVTRQSEIQLRVDLGARRSRLFRQLLTESLLLGFFGTLVALPLSAVALRLILTQSDAPSWMSALPDWRVVLFTAAMGCLASILFALLPTLRLIRAKDRGKALAHQFVVCAQVAASCVLLVLASLLVHATLHTLYTDPGFGYEQVLSIDPGMSDHGYTPATARSYLETLQVRLRSVPGVASVSIAQFPPLVSEEVHMTSIDVDGQRVLIYPNWVSPEFFQTMSIPILRGRALSANDKDSVVISESLARRRWPDEDPVGKAWSGGKLTVVGVAGNTRAMEMNNSDATELYYLAGPEQLPSMSVLVKANGAPDNLVKTLLSLASVSSPGDPSAKKLYPTIALLRAGFRKNVARAEEITFILSLLGGIAIFLACIGLVGLVGYAVTQRTKEIAIRLAIGATRMEIFRTVLRHFAWPTMIGMLVGVAGATALSQILRRMLYGISGLDPLSYLAAILMLSLILGAAAMIPIRRAFRLDVARILHFE
ncbi:MAG TPA: ABC transporter permease [Acidobacteriaceae bacterium]